MGSSDDMFERGTRDAEQDELNSFYYQHYYHYRRGYDQARRRIRHTPPAPAGGGNVRSLPLFAVGLFILVALGILAYGLWGRGSPSEASLSAPSVAPSVAQPSIPTRIPRIPTATPVPPTPLPPALQLQGAALVVNLSGGPLRLRAGAGTKQKVVGRLPEGTAVKLVEGPVEADGYTWWRVEAGKDAGWAAERSQEGVVWLQPQP